MDFEKKHSHKYAFCIVITTKKNADTRLPCDSSLISLVQPMNNFYVKNKNYHYSTTNLTVKLTALVRNIALFWIIFKLHNIAFNDAKDTRCLYGDN